MPSTILLKSKALAARLVLVVALGAAIPLVAGNFNASTWPQISQEEFSAAPPGDKRAWMQRMHADLKLDAPGNTKALQILVWGLRDKEAEIRKAAAQASVAFLTKLRNACRQQKAGKLPIKRGMISEVERALHENLEDPSPLVRSDVVAACICLRGSVDGCAEAALKLLNELSPDITEQWGKRENLLQLMVYTGYSKTELPLSYPHPNSRKPGEPLKGTKLEPWKKKENDKTWFDFLENSIP